MKQYCEYGISKVDNRLSGVYHFFLLLDAETVRSAPHFKEMEVVVARISNLIGAITANVYMLLVIAVFIARMLGQLEIGQWLGLASTLTLIPLAYLFAVGLYTNRRRIYFVWLALMILFLLFELIGDQYRGRLQEENAVYRGGNRGGAP